MNEIEEESREFWDDGSDDAADEAIQSLEERPKVSSQDSIMADVDLRLETADYYRSILSHEFFALDTEAAQTVHDEIRAFIRERLEVLLGIRGDNRLPVKVELPFDPEEVEALKLLASKVLRKPALVAATPEVELKKMPTPKSSSAPIPPRRTKPQMRKVPPPPVLPSTKPRTTPTVAPKQAVQAPKRKPGRPRLQEKLTGEEQTFTNLKGQEVTLREGEIIEEGIKRFIVKKNDAGTLYRQDITGQVASPTRNPPMSPQQYAQMTEMQAQAQVAAFADAAGKSILGQ